MKWKSRISKIKHAAKNGFNSTRIIGLFYVAFCKRQPIRPDVVLFESHNGIDFIGNPYYMAEHVLSSEKYNHLKIVIVCPSSARRQLSSIFKTRSVTFCKTNTLRYCFHLATAGYLVNDVTFPLYFSRRDQQRYLNTWHGTPLKTLGRKSAQGKFTYITNTQRNFLHATDLLAPNKHTEQVLLQDYMIEKIWDGRVLNCGYPRNDILVNQNQITVQTTKRNLDVVFMPTWRGTLSTLDEASELQLAQLRTLFDYLDESLPTSIILWIRLHPIVRGEIDLQNYKHLKAFPNDEEPYRHLAKCDVLITDYSSVMFDFAATRKPILLYTPDVEAYRGERDFCIALESLPFDRLTTPDALVKRLASFVNNIPDCNAEYAAFIARFCSRDQGKSTEDLCSYYFLDENRVDVRKNLPDTQKKNVLIYSGAFLNNGITTSLKNFLSLVDKDKYNIFICIDTRHGEARGTAYFGALDERIGYIPVRAWLTVDPFDAVRAIFRDIFYLSLKPTDDFLRSLWTKEYQRLFATAKIDTFIHFCGYTRRVSMLLLGSPAKKIVFFHNDMAQEINAYRVNDTRALQLSYELADVVATVRQDAEAPYCNEHFDFRSKVIHVPNTLSLHCKELSQRPLHEAFREGVESPEYPRIANSIDAQGKFRFINLARFSPEKGQLRLIDAFEKIWAKNPASELYIVGSHGASYKDILQRAESSVAHESIYIVIGSGNPFPLMARMNTFVFSSFYEGIGLVLYEAFSLGLHVISTDIPGPSELLGQGYGLVVPDNTEGLVSGMHAALQGKVPHRPYDFDAHNKFALEQFYKAIDAEALTNPLHKQDAFRLSMLFRFFKQQAATVKKIIFFVTKRKKL